MPTIAGMLFTLATAATAGPAPSDFVTLSGQLDTGALTLPVIAGDAQCAPGTPNLVVQDDGVAENGYGLGPGAQQGWYLLKFTPSIYPRSYSDVCFAFISAYPDETSLEFDLVVYDDDGADGRPGTLLGSRRVTTDGANLFPEMPSVLQFVRFSLEPLDLEITAGSVYIGARWSPQEGSGELGQPDRFLAMDESPTTLLREGYAQINDSGWLRQGVEVHPFYRSSFIRATESIPGDPTPSVTLSYAPGTILEGQTTELVITLTNPLPQTAQLVGTFTHFLPAGMTVAPEPHRQFDCQGVFTANPGTGNVRFSSSVLIPGNDSCRASVRVRTIGTGSYTGTIAAGAMRTTLGNNLYPTSATLTVNAAGGPYPAPYCAIDFAAEVEPITRLTFGGIDHRSDAAPGATLALENFTAIVGTVVRGGSHPVTVEGHTGGLANHVRVFIDWNQNGQFETGEQHDIGLLGPSTGDDGVRVLGTITVPENAYVGNTRLRVIKQWSDVGSACSSSGYGQAEDYSLTVTPMVWMDPPVMSLTPATVAITTAADAAGEATLTIANASQREPLQFETGGHGRRVDLAPAPRVAGDRLGNRLWRAPQILSWPVADGAHAPRWDAWFFRNDDGSYETAYGYNHTQQQYPAVFINRFTVPPGSEGLVIDSIAVAWPDPGTANGDLVGKQVNLVAYYDANGEGDVWGAVRLGGDHVVEIGATGVFERYPVNFTVPGEGDVFIGYSDVFASGGTSPILMTSGMDADASVHGYFSGNPNDADPDLDNLGKNEETGPIDWLSGGGRYGSWMIRATALTGSGPACTGPIIPWLSVTPDQGTVIEGTALSITVRADAAAGDLEPGHYDAQLCVGSNDPGQPLVVVPVSVTVSATVECPSDRIFANGFDDAGNGACPEQQP